MKRTAIIANANSNDAAGVQQDVSDWHTFLVSPVGGAWLASEEIRILSNPSREDILNLVRPAATDDYVIVVFLGSGELRKDRLGFPETFLSLNESSVISERELNPRNDRCSIFIDSGRVDSGAKLVVAQPKQIEGIEFSHARSLFDAELEKAEKGCVKIYAPNLGRHGQHSHSFSGTLISQSSEWATRNHGTLDLHQAISLTSGVFERSSLPEGPLYQGGRRLHHFPFSVNPTE